MEWKFSIKYCNGWELIGNVFWFIERIQRKKKIDLFPRSRCSPILNFTRIYFSIRNYVYYVVCVCVCGSFLLAIKCLFCFNWSFRFSVQRLWWLMAINMCCWKNKETESETKRKERKNRKPIWKWHEIHKEKLFALLKLISHLYFFFSFFVYYQFDFACVIVCVASVWIHIYHIEFSCSSVAQLDASRLSIFVLPSLFRFSVRWIHVHANISSDTLH